MKKIIVLLTVTVMSAVAMAQSKTASSKKIFLGITSGASLPLGDFNSKKESNSHAGYAKTGFNFDLQGGYLLRKKFSIAASAFYSRNATDGRLYGEGNSPSIDHWQFYGLTVGPMYSVAPCNKSAIDLSIMTGFVSANSPKLSEGNQVLVTEDWAMAIPVKLSGAFRYNITSCVYATAGLSYIYMEPKFEFSSLGDPVSLHQKFSVMNINGGIGIKF